MYNTKIIVNQIKSSGTRLNKMFFLLYKMT